MLKSFIRSLTSFINTNRQDIRTTLKCSSILTAGIMGMFAFHPALMSVWAYIAAGFDTMMLGFTFAAETVSHFIYEAAAGLWAGIAKVAAYLYASSLVLATVVGEWFKAIEQWVNAFVEFMSLPILEMANISVENVGYTGTVILVFIATTIIVYITKQTIHDTVEYFKSEGKGIKLEEISSISMTVIILTSIIAIIPFIIIEHRRNRDKTNITTNTKNDFSESELSRSPDGKIKYKTKTSK